MWFRFPFGKIFPDGVVYVDTLEQIARSQGGKIGDREAGKRITAIIQGEKTEPEPEQEQWW